MDVNSVDAGTKSYLNLNTGMATSNPNNKHIFNPEALRANFVEIRPVENLEARPLNLPPKSYVDKGNNEISFAKAQRLT